MRHFSSGPNSAVHCQDQDRGNIYFILVSSCCRSGYSSRQNGLPLSLPRTYEQASPLSTHFPLSHLSLACNQFAELVTMYTTFYAPFGIALIFLTAWVVLTRWVVGWYINPLRKLPGPRFACLTDLWRLRNALSGREEIINLELHEKYGEYNSSRESTLSFALKAQA